MMRTGGFACPPTPRAEREDSRAKNNQAAAECRLRFLPDGVSDTRFFTSEPKDSSIFDSSGNGSWPLQKRIVSTRYAVASILYSLDNLAGISVVETAGEGEQVEVARLVLRHGNRRFAGMLASPAGISPAGRSIG